MKKIFADSCYWIGLFDPADELHLKAVEARDRYNDSQIVTTEEVLTEFLTHMRASKKNRRTMAYEFLVKLKEQENVKIIPQSHQSFEEGVRLFRSRNDKDYSLQDCISMRAMEHYDIIHVLTNDHHFTQEGLVILL